MLRTKILAAALLCSQIAPAIAQQTSCQAGLNEFNKLKTGMTYIQVAKVIGCKGSLLSSSDLAGLKTEMYMWEGEGGLGSNMNATFQNDKLVMKAQYGLE